MSALASILNARLQDTATRAEAAETLRSYGADLLTELCVLHHMPTNGMSPREMITLLLNDTFGAAPVWERPMLVILPTPPADR